MERAGPSTRTEDLVRKSHEYATAGIGQYWVVDPDAGVLEVFANVDGGAGGWERLLRLDAERLTGEVTVGDLGTVALDVRDVLPGSFA